MKSSKPSKPKLSVRLHELLSKEARVGAKLDRITSRRLGASPTDYRPRGGPLSTTTTTGPSNATLRVEQGGQSVARRKSSISLASTASGMKALSETFRKGPMGEMSSLRSDYKNLIKLLDNLDYQGWKNLSGHLVKSDVKLRLLESTQ